MKKISKQQGFSLVEVLVGILLVVVIFVGIINAFSLTLKVVSQSKARITALSLAGKRIEQIRNLSYNNVGTIGGIPSGLIPQIETKTLNSITFTITTSIINIDDSFDNKAPTDTVPNDYKRAKVKISWVGKVGGEAILLTDIAPKGIETTAGGGTIMMFVQNASGIGVGQAEVRIVNNSVSPPIDASYLTDDYGYLALPGAPTSTEAYKITVQKTGYSQERSYGREEIANPLKPHLSVYVGQLTEPSFSIDQLATLNVETRAQQSFDDDFNNFDKVSDYTDIELETSQARLKKVNGQYVSSGYLVSAGIAPASLVNWDSLYFSDSETEAAKIKYHIYYATGTQWELIPDSDLPNNNIGLESSPVSLSLLDAGTYSGLKIWADFSTTDINVSPTLENWSVYYNTPLLDNVAFHVRGGKTLGTDEHDQPVYKYSYSHLSNANGKLFLNDMEWDSYTFSPLNNNGLDLLRITPANPTELLPGLTITTKLYYRAENSLLATILNASTSAPIFGANAHLYNESLGYSRVLPTDKNGKSYFLPLSAATYTLSVEAYGYASTSASVAVSGEKLKTIYLTPNE